MNLEDIRRQFSNACCTNDIETAGVIFSKHLDIDNKFCKATYEQGLMLAVKNGSLAVTAYLLDAQNFRNPHNLASLHYCALFDCQNECPNVDMLRCLCFGLSDKDELLKIKEEEDFPNKIYYDDFLQSRIEKEVLELSVDSCETSSNRSFKI